MRMLLLAAGALLAASAVSAAPAPSAAAGEHLAAQGRGVDSWLSLGREAMEQRRYPKAMEIYLTVLEAHPGHLEAKKRLVEISGAVQAWERATSLHPRELAEARAKAHAARRRSGADSSRQNAELEAVRRSLAGKNASALLAPSVSLTRGSEDEFVDAHYLALAKAYLERLQERLRAALTAGELQDPKDLHIARGFLYYHRGLLEAALEEWQAALSRDVNDEILKEQIGWLGARVKKNRDQEMLVKLFRDAEKWHRMGLYDKSIEAWTGVLALEPRNGKAIEGLANAQRRLKDDLLKVHLDRAWKLEKANRSLDALRDWVAALEIDSSNAQALTAVRSWRSRQPASSAAAPAARKVLSPAAAARNPGGAEERYAIGMAYYAQRDLLQALDSMERALELNPALRKASVAVERIRAELGR